MGTFENQAEETMTVKAGHAAVLNFPHIESSPPPDVTWQTDEGQMAYSAQYTKSNNNQLVILSANAENEKSYR